MVTEIYSTDTDSGLLSVIQRDENGFKRVAQIRVGNAPRGSVKFTKDGRGFVSNTSTNTISEIDGLNHTEVGRIEVGSGPRGLHLTADDRYLLVSNSGSDTLSIVDVERRLEVRQIHIGRDPRHMAITGDTAIVCLWGEGSLAQLDIASLAKGDVDGVVLTKKIKLGNDTFPYSVNIHPSGNLAFVACNALQVIPVVDLTKGEIAAHVEVRAGGARAVAFTPDGAHALVSLERDSTIAVISVETMNVTRYLEVGPGPRGVTIDKQGTVYSAAFSRPTVARVDIPDYGAHSVSIIELDDVNLNDPHDNVNLQSVPVGFGPCSVSVFEPDTASRVRSERSVAFINA